MSPGMDGGRSVMTPFSSTSVTAVTAWMRVDVGAGGVEAGPDGVGEPVLGRHDDDVARC